VTTAGLHLPVSRLTHRVTSSSGRGQLSLPSRPGSSTAVGTRACRRRRTTTDVYIAHQRRRGYARRSTANRSPTDIRCTSRDVNGCRNQLSPPTSLRRQPCRVSTTTRPSHVNAAADTPVAQPSTGRRRTSAALLLIQPVRVNSTCRPSWVYTYAYRRV